MNIICLNIIILLSIPLPVLHICRCHPTTADDGKWSTTSSSLPLHGAGTPQQQPTISSNTSPTIVINAAAAAAIAPIAAATTSGITHEIQPTPLVGGTPTELNKQHPVVLPPASEELVSHHVTTNHDPENDDGSDFYVIKAKRKRKPRIERPWLQYSDKDFPLQKVNDNDEYSEEQDEDELNELGSAMPPSEQYLETAASNLRPITNRERSPTHGKHKERHHHHRHQHPHHHDHHTHHRSRDERKLKGAGGAFDDAAEGDVFQYEDFDIDISSHDDNDMSYEDSAEYNEYRNSTGFTPPKERATPEHLIPKRRRIYSKWSRWTKCTPKCTTRRYK